VPAAGAPVPPFVALLVRSLPAGSEAQPASHPLATTAASACSHRHRAAAKRRRDTTKAGVLRARAFVPDLFSETRIVSSRRSAARRPARGPSPGRIPNHCERP
jgi:hypothetical protein